MVVTRLIGGLGNQMFQYAVGRSLSHKLGVELKLDIFGFDRYDLRRYELSSFNISERFATMDDIRATKFLNRSMVVKILDKIRNSTPTAGSYYFEEKELFHFDSEVLQLPDNTYLEGSWQCPEYFEEIETIIRKEFTLKDGLSEESLKVEEHIESCCSCSLHIRRGDYVNNKVTNNIHGLCDMQYYQNAVKYLQERFDNLHCFVFSDDPEWVKENLELSCPMTVVGHNGADKAYEDMILLSKCNHHIIANSTFSWWGAWLGSLSDKIVIAPKRWANDLSYDARDLIPEDWVRV